METLTVQNEHSFYEVYNTTKIVFKNGVEKIKKTSFDNIKGLSRRNSHNGTYSTEQIEEKTKKYLKEVKNNIINLAFNFNAWEYFITLTFDFRKVGEYSHEKAIDMLKKWINNQKHQNVNMTYLLVPEFHKDSGHLHFHGLIANVPKWIFTEARDAHTGELIIISGLQIYNLTNYKLGFTTISKIQNQEKVSNYISKYATKDLITLKNKKRYWYSRNLEKPKKEYLYLEKTLKEHYQDKNVLFEKTVERANCCIELLNFKTSDNLNSSEVPIIYIMLTS